MRQFLIDFKDMKINKATLQSKLGEDLYNVENHVPVVVCTGDVVNAIYSFLDAKISVEQLVEWVNVIWFTGLYEYPDEETDSIISVLEVLETLDENNVTVSTEEYEAMIEALNANEVFKCSYAETFCV